MNWKNRWNAKRRSFSQVVSERKLPNRFSSQWGRRGSQPSHENLRHYAMTVVFKLNSLSYARSIQSHWKAFQPTIAWSGLSRLQLISCITRLVVVAETMLDMRCLHNCNNLHNLTPKGSLTRSPKPAHTAIVILRLYCYHYSLRIQLNTQSEQPWVLQADCGWIMTIVEPQHLLYSTSTNRNQEVRGHCLWDIEQRTCLFYPKGIADYSRNEVSLPQFQWRSYPLSETLALYGTWAGVGLTGRISDHGQRSRCRVTFLVKIKGRWWKRWHP